MLYELLSCVFGLLGRAVFDEDVAQAFYSRLYLLQVDLHRTGNHYSNHIAVPFRHFGHVLDDLVVFLIDGQLLDCHDVLQHHYSARRKHQPLLDPWRLHKTAHGLHLPQNSVDVAVTAEFRQQLLVVLDILFRPAQLQLLCKKKGT